MDAQAKETIKVGVTRVYKTQVNSPREGGFQVVQCLLFSFGRLCLFEMWAREIRRRPCGDKERGQLSL